MKATFKDFQELHDTAEPLLIGNVWNVQSARVFEKLGYKAIGTSSAAVAESLGYEDGEQMSFAEYLYVVKRIVASVSLPLSVDLEGGYGVGADAIVANIKAMYHAGVVGINIEDSIVLDGKRSIDDEETFSNKIRHICNSLRSANVHVFVNVRTDVFLLGLENAVSDAVSRTRAYQDSGAHGLFFPCITKLADIEAITRVATLPVNVMAMPGLPPFSDLKKAGVRRISMGNFINKKTYQSLEEFATAIETEGSFNSLF